MVKKNERISDREVVILCGGKGTRMGEVSKDIPKPLIPIGDKPILWHVMKIYASQGFNNFILCLGHQGQEIVKYFQQNKTKGWKIRFRDTGTNTSKSDRIAQLKSLIRSEDFFCAYGDDVADVDLHKLLKQHKQHKPVVTITKVRMISGFGIVLAHSSTGLITEFKEKPVLDLWMNGGFMVMNRKIFDYLDKGELEEGVFNALVKEKQIRAYEHEGQWKTMNTLKDNIELTTLWNKGEAFWKIWEEKK